MAFDDYQGKEGYHRMIEELRQGLYRDYPEAKGQIYIVDMLFDRDEEAARAGDVLGIPDLKKQIDFTTKTGEMVTVTRPDGTKARLCFGDFPSETIDSLEIGLLAKKELHEIGHAISKQFYPEYDRDGKEEFDKGRYEESHVEAFAAYAIVKAGAFPKQEGYRLAAQYDKRKYDPYNRDGSFDFYDPGEPLTKMLHTLPVDEQRHFTTYVEIPLRSDYETTLKTFEELRETQKDQAFQHISDSALGDVALKMSVEGRSEDEIIKWVIEHRDVVARGDQVASGVAYWDNPQGDYFSPSPILEGSVVQNVARAVQKYREPEKIGKSGSEEEACLAGKSFGEMLAYADIIGVTPNTTLFDYENKWTQLSRDDQNRIVDAMAQDAPLKQVLDMIANTPQDPAKLSLTIDELPLDDQYLLNARCFDISKVNDNSR